MTKRSDYILLKNIYENVRHPASFSSPRKLFLAAKQVQPNITKKTVDNWLLRNKTYTLHRRATTRFHRRPVLVRGPFHQYQADLVDYQPLWHSNGGNRYLLTVIDCFSRYAVVVPIKRKTAQCLLEAFKKAFDFMKIPKKVQTDEGSEFYNSLVGNYFKQNKIIHFSTHTGLKAQMCERFNRTMRDKLLKYMTANKTLRYLNALPDLIYSYNATPHSSLGGYFAPKDVNEKNRDQVFNILYGAYLKKRKRKHNFEIGDTVRISNLQPASEKIRKKNAPNFSKELYKIAEKMDTQPPMYKVFDPREKEVLIRRYYETEVQPFVEEEEEEEKDD